MPQPAALHQDEGLPYAEPDVQGQGFAGTEGVKRTRLGRNIQLLQSISVDIPAVNIKAAASPKPRPAAMIRPVMIRGKQAGKRTCQMVCQWEAPRPKLPLR